MAPLIRDTRFHEIYETKPDSKHRVTLGSCRVRAHHYRVYENESGQIVLDPQTRVSSAEAWLYRNKKALAAVRRGLSQARSGKLVKAPEDYRKYT
ncbi:MAG: hypothetical protein IPN19_01895 [Elusimicrobia bacterium]|nr:hypothetical protein [Elusimicrobiota bacterium]